jgi:hypothetical protein
MGSLVPFVVTIDNPAPSTPLAAQQDRRSPTSSGEAVLGIG